MHFQLSKFFVVPGVKRRIELDFVRGVAILMVMGVHFVLPPTRVPFINAVSSWFNVCGGAGVDMFFVLSGFLVGGLLLKEYRAAGTVHAKRFLLRRGFKIWPPFYFLLLVQCVVRSHPPNTFLWQNAFHVQNYFGSTLRQTWSLAIEEHFYLSLAFLLALLASRGASPERLLLTMAGLCLGALALRTATVWSGNLDGAFRWTQNRLDSLMFGVMIATLFHLKPVWYETIARQRAILATLSAVAFGFLWFAEPHLVFMRTAGFTICYLGFGAFLILAYEHSGALRTWFVYRFLAWIGVYSYGIYLWHTTTVGPAVKLAARLPFDARWPVAVLFQFVASVAAGVVLTHLVEWPFLRWRERHLGKQKDPVEPPPMPAQASTVEAA